MARDARWPFIPLVIVRAVQGVFAIIILGTSGFVVSGHPWWWAALGLVTSLFTLIWVAITFVLLFMGLLLPLAVVIVDAFLLVFYLISMAGVGDSGFVSSDCSFGYSLLYSYSYDYDYDFDLDEDPTDYCHVSKAAFAFELLSMFLFIASTAYASFILHKNRKDLRGKKYRASQAANPEGGNVVPMVPQGAEAYPTGEPKQEYYGAAPAATVSPVYGQDGQQYYPQQPQQTYVQGPPAQFVSPPSSPPPPQGGIPPQSTGEYSNVSSQPTAARSELPNQ